MVRPVVPMARPEAIRRAVFSRDMPLPGRHGSPARRFSSYSALLPPVVIIVLVLVLRGCGGNTYTSPIETTLDVIISGRFDRASAQKILDQIPDPVMDMAFDMQQYGGEYFTESDLAALSG